MPTAILHLLTPALPLQDIGAEPDSPQQEIPAILLTLDLVLLAIGAAIVAYWLVRRIRGRTSGLLADAPLRPNQFRPESALLIALVFVLVGGAASTILRGDQSRLDDTQGVLVSNIAQLSVIVAACVIAHQQFSGGIRRFVLGNPPVIRAALLGIPYALAAILVTELVHWLVIVVLLLLAPGIDMPTHTVIGLLQGPDVSAWIVLTLLVGTVGVAPIAEEMFFRGILQSMLGTRLGRRWTAILLTSVAFALMHGEWHARPALLVLGIGFGVAYERTGSLATPIVMHALFNARTLVFVLFGNFAGSE